MSVHQGTPPPLPPIRPSAPSRGDRHHADNAHSCTLVGQAKVRQSVRSNSRYVTVQLLPKMGALANPVHP